MSETVKSVKQEMETKHVEDEKKTEKTFKRPASNEKLEEPTGRRTDEKSQKSSDVKEERLPRIPKLTETTSTNPPRVRSAGKERTDTNDGLDDKTKLTKFCGEGLELHGRTLETPHMSQDEVDKKLRPHQDKSRTKGDSPLTSLRTRDSPLTSLSDRTRDSLLTPLRTRDSPSTSGSTKDLFLFSSPPKTTSLRRASPGWTEAQTKDRISPSDSLERKAPPTFGAVCLHACDRVAPLHGAPQVREEMEKTLSADGCRTEAEILIQEMLDKSRAKLEEEYADKLKEAKIKLKEEADATSCITRSVASLRRICHKVAPPGRKHEDFKLARQTLCEKSHYARKFFQSWLQPEHPYDEVFPNVLLGDDFLGRNPQKCKELDITHILNAAQGVRSHSVNTDESLFQPFGIKFMGVRAQDIPQFDLAAYFHEAADFIHQGLAPDAATGSGKVFVHCHQGKSRSTSLLCAYLMIKQGMSAEQALTMIRLKREVAPNRGFLKQLCQLDQSLKKNNL